MNAKRSRAYKRLFKKFDALRATLPDDERDILDSIVKDEVEAHRMAGTKIAKRVVFKKAQKKAEVEAHRMAGTRIAKRVVSKKAQKKAEVEAHRMAGTKIAKRVVSKKVQKKAAK